MECATCPYGREEYERRTRYNTDNTDIFCDKTGGKVSIFGYCEDVNSDIPRHENHSKKRKSNRIERNIKYKSHLKYLSEISNYPKPAYYIEEIKVKRYHYIKNPKPYYKRVYRDKDSPYLKKISNRKIRRYKGEISNGWNCHRLFDFWWEMY